jgi:hypothetical protein
LITCFIRYTINPERLDDFELYAQVWMRLIEKYGGTHHGYFVPGADPPSAAFSFPGIGEAGPNNVAMALFSFPSVETYENYRRDVKQDPECAEITHHFEQTKCFTKYERVFMRRVARD